MIIIIIIIIVFQFCRLLILPRRYHYISVQVSIADDKIGSAYISGGGLNGNYTAVQLHFHWGRNNNEGSEHTFRGRKYPLEVSQSKIYEPFRAEKGSEQMRTEN